MNNFDFVIFGGGLAGIWAHHEFSKHGKCLVIDNPLNQKSSVVAGGVYNPMMLNYTKKAFLADIIYPKIEEFYNEIEIKINAKIIHPKKIKYVLNSNENLNQWSVEIEKFTNFCIFTKDINTNIIADFGVVEVAHSGWVDVKKMIEIYHQYLLKNNELIYETKNLNEVKKLFYNAKYYIYSTGVFAHEFSHLLKPAKGEVLIIQSDIKDMENIYQQGVFLLPMGNGFYKVGSNFEWKNLNNEPTIKARKEIESKLQKFFKGYYEIVNHLAGIRPSSLDRRPIIKKISENEFLFNGLGSKGVALAPHFSKLLVKEVGL